MTRLFFASIGFAVLQLAIPHSASAADVRPRGESTRLEPRVEMLSGAEVFRVVSRPADILLGNPTPFAPGVPTTLGVRPLFCEPLTREPARAGPLSRRFQRPHSRAPPA